MMPATSVLAGWFARATLLAVALLMVAPGFCGYEARLWFRNVTQGTDNAGALLAAPGDQVSVRFRFVADTPAVEKWGILLMTMILDGLTLVSEADANACCIQTMANWPCRDHPIRVCHGPPDGPMHDYLIDPSDARYAFVAERGCYALGGSTGSSPCSWDTNRELFRFTVQPGSEGEVLNWAFDGRETEEGLATRMIDYTGTWVDVTDNWVVVVPEPFGQMGVLAGTLILSLVRRRPDAAT